MRINISARHFRASRNLKNFTEDEVKRLKKYYDGIIDCEIVFEKQKEIRSCEIMLKVYGTRLTASERTDDHFKSVVGAVDKLENQLRKYKSKLRNQRNGRSETKIPLGS
ncbi:MAG: ribosome-associated translation inhibitor RaiA [candidate division Zixibacteria bacterium]|nr:ribosome-associated translation inhibitor RaiA [Candidatus Tariuqbacter arcticus]